MVKNISTLEINKSNNGRIYSKIKSVFKVSKVENFTSEFVKFYTFHAGFKKKRHDLLKNLLPKLIYIIFDPNINQG